MHIRVLSLAVAITAAVLLAGCSATGSEQSGAVTADGGTVAGPGEAVVEPPGLERLGDGPVAALDILEHRDGRRQPARQPHQMPPR